jgi:transcriptional regulator with XRE-family HTH domain
MQEKIKGGLKMNIGKILKAVREAKNISLRDIAAMAGVSFAAVAQVEKGLPSLSEPKIFEIAKIYGIKSIESDGKVVFYSEMLHICYIPVSYRIVQWDFFYSFLSLIVPTEMVLFTRQKQLIAIAIKDIHNCIFLFLPRSGEKLGKTGIIENIIEKAGIKKTMTKTVELKEGLKNISKNELEQYFFSVYCYTCPRISAILPDGRTLFIPVVPIGAILEDLYHYLHYETDPVRKEYTFLDLFHWLQKILQKTDVEISADLEKARKIWNF